MAGTHATNDGQTAALGPTMDIAQWVAGTELSDIGPVQIRWARHCLLDWLAVTIPGAHDPLVEILVAEALADEATGRIPLLGRSEKLTPSWAILVNGTAGHALDFDDVNRTLHGHPTVAIMPAVLTAAAVEGRPLEDALAAFVIGYEAGCLVGKMTGDAHYDKGWHATATVGAFGAAAGVSALLGLDAEKTAYALGTTATMAAGLKSMFGTMCKPLHAGRAAQSGYLAARTAARGFVSRLDALECDQGFWDTQAPDHAIEAVTRQAEDPFFIEQNLFKYHAACYMTHSAIEACDALRREHGFVPEDVEGVRLRVAESNLKVCNIPDPTTGLEIKFSLRHTAAMALMGMDTAGIDSYSDANANDKGQIDLRRRVTVEPLSVARTMAAQAEVVVTLSDGRVLPRVHDVAVPATDLDLQEKKLSAKFDALVLPVLGEGLTHQLKTCALTQSGNPLSPV